MGCPPMAAAVSEDEAGQPAELSRPRRPASEAGAPDSCGGVRGAFYGGGGGWEYAVRVARWEASTFRKRFSWWGPRFEEGSTRSALESASVSSAMTHPSPEMGRRPRERRTIDENFVAIGPIVRSLENYGVMLLLFETPSGFAIFTTSEVYLYLRDTLPNIWSKFGSIDKACCEVFLMEFQTFKDKSDAINADTGVNEQLAGMIKKWHLGRKMKLGVGKPEYKTIIESKLGIPCVFNEIIMEIMWGIQHLIRELIPEEKSEVTKQDRLPMSQGLHQLLLHYGFHIEPDMVNQQIVLAACALHDCDVVYKQCVLGLSYVPLELKKISDINCEDWDALKLITALKVLVFPEEEIDFPELFAEDELSKMKADAHKYEGIIPDVSCSTLYWDIISAHHLRIEKKELLGSLVKEAEEAHEADDAEAYDKRKRQGVSEQIPQELESAPYKRSKRSAANRISS